ncbi:MliC family protein [Bradyrhizobium septentrionale]|uniref:MliC family protein n=1 Tax=Bradyrhizobium septentrionale TaxID=1404411 RepID=A0A974A210_9BRAD|nr:MliC family protein [Bradyrhizobium septentrionale]UGY13990.1 MliC family protein [Bradyrhizobium septentrionale]UGY22544.1 MliC family protein [Bradyrhizobium septentrionale]
MTYRGGAILVGAMVLGVFGPQAASAQSAFRNYRCADGTQFVAGFFTGDTRAHLQLDGKAVTLTKRLSLTGTRYKGGGVTLEISRSGLARLRHAKRPATACELA